MKILLTLITGSLLFTTISFATIINVPADYSTIQSGIDAASNGDTVLVSPGTYTENINYNGKIIVVGSLFLTTSDTSYISSTIIDGGQSGSVVTFWYGEDMTTVLSGFTIKNGSGGGIYCASSSPSLVNLTISNNLATWNGGGIYCYNSSPSLENVTIANNSVPYDGGGGGIFCEHSSSPSLENVTISGNSASDGGGISCYDNSSPSLMNVTISGNSASDGGGISCWYSSSPSLVNLTISNNLATWNGGGIYCYNSSPSLINTIVSGNTGNYGIYVDSGNPSITYSDFYNNENGNFHNCGVGVGVNVTTNANGDSCDAYYNIQEDPLFVDPVNGDYHLSWTNYPVQDSTMSPCIDAGDPNSPYDPDSTIADIGAFYFNQSLSISEENISMLPEEFNLHQNYPNPFNPITKISYQLPKSAFVTLFIYNLTGQLVEKLVSDQKNAGYHTAQWDARQAGSGIYFYRIDAGTFCKVRKCLVIK